MAEIPRYPIPGSERAEAPEASGHRPIDPTAPIEVTVMLRRRTDGEISADPADVDVVTTVLQGAGLQIVSADAPSRRVRVRGPASAVAAVFGTRVDVVTSRAPDGRTVTHRQRTGELSVPAELGERVLAVLGIDDRPQARSQLRIAASAVGAISYTPPQLAEIYVFPADTDGTGQ